MPRLSLAAFAACAAAASGALAATASYPDRPVRLVVPYPPGGNIDITARTIAPGLTEALGVQIVVDNRAGAGGTIGSELVAKAPPDGYTLLMGSTGTLATAQALYPKLGFDPLNDFAYTSLVSQVALVAITIPSLPARNVQELIALLKERPGRVTMASSGVVVPARTPQDIVKRLYAAVIKTLRLPATRDGFARAGADVIESTPEQFEKLLRSENAKWAKVIRDGNVKVD